MKKSAALILLLPAFGGMAALSWEVIWQLKTSLSFGVSATGAAITLATMMAGMTIGAALGGKLIDKKKVSNPLRMYGILELCIGFCGIALGACFSMLERLDVWVYQLNPAMAPLAHLAGVVFVILIPAACMGASIPVFGKVSERYKISVALLYGLNTLGAAAGTLLVAFWLIPTFGLQQAAIATALLNCLVGVAAFMPLTDQETALSAGPTQQRLLEPTWDVLAVVFATGFATFLLEVAWFRALRAAFETTTTGFAIMLAVVLLALGVAARSVPYLKAKFKRLDYFLLFAGVAIFIGTPMVERLDLILLRSGTHNTPFHWFGLTLILVGPAVFLLGVALPWFLESEYSSKGLGKIYAVNTIGSVLGALSAAWIFLPTLGFAATAWVAGAVVVFVAYYAFREVKLPAWGLAAGATAALIAVSMNSGVGKSRILLSFAYGEHKVIEHSEGPDSATSAIEFANGSRGVFIDGFAAAAFWPTAHYMDWMGSLPALMNEDPKEALVICFGTGQTANAVRNEGLERTTIVDINPAVFRIAHHFPDNDRVLEDPKVEKVLMDGRAFLRRTKQTFDIITMEPMPPNHAGVNALYSREFYELAKAKLRPGGIVAQWLPAHLVSEDHARSIASTFQDVFPNAGLWADPDDSNGILLGTNTQQPLGWPGLDKPGPERSLSNDEIRAALVLGGDELRKYANGSPVVTDDNQLLAYGKRFSLKENGPRSIEAVRNEFLSARGTSDENKISNGSRAAEGFDPRINTR